jgi:hypothetical protein
MLEYHDLETDGFGVLARRKVSRWRNWQRKTYNALQNKNT